MHGTWRIHLLSVRIYVQYQQQKQQRWDNIKEDILPLINEQAWMVFFVKDEEMKEKSRIDGNLFNVIEDQC